ALRRADPRRSAPDLSALYGSRRAGIRASELLAEALLSLGLDCHRARRLSARVDHFHGQRDVEGATRGKLADIREELVPRHPVLQPRDVGGLTALDRAHARAVRPAVLDALRVQVLHGFGAGSRPARLALQHQRLEGGPVAPGGGRVGPGPGGPEEE